MRKLLCVVFLLLAGVVRAEEVPHFNRLENHSHHWVQDHRGQIFSVQYPVMGHSLDRAVKAKGNVGLLRWKQPPDTVILFDCTGAALVPLTKENRLALATLKPASRDVSYEIEFVAKVSQALPGHGQSPLILWEGVTIQKVTRMELVTVEAKDAKGRIIRGGIKEPRTEVLYPTTSKLEAEIEKK